MDEEGPLVALEGAEEGASVAVVGAFEGLRICGES